MTAPPPLSVVILTLDEEALVARCVSAHRWADEVLVVDSGSTDRTRELARAAGARVVEQPWLGWSRQRDAGALAAAHDWVLFVDCDEVVDPTLRDSIRATLAGDPDPRDGFSVDRRNEWFGILLPNDQRRSMIRSFVRLFHRGHSHYDPDAVVHERVLVTGSLHLLDGVLIQWRHETLADMTARATRYAGVEADLAVNAGRGASRARAAVMPAVRMVWMLLVRRNILLGTAGVLHALHKANGEWMRQLTLFERLETPAFAPGTVEAVMGAQNDAGGLGFEARFARTSTSGGWASFARTSTSGGLARFARTSTSGERPTGGGLAGWRIWWAVARLVGIAGRGLTEDPEALLHRYARWNQAWLEPAKAWEARHVVARPHPPGYEPPG